jgi:hypothetical protein
MRNLRIVALALLLAGAATAAAVFGQQPGPLVGQQSYPAPQFGVWQSQPPSQSADLARQYVKATKEEDKREIRKKMVDVLNQQFDEQIQHQQKELEYLEKQIADLRALLKKRQDAKNTIVDRRIEQLVQDADGLGWSAPGTPRAPYYAPMSGLAAPRPAPVTAPAKKP